MANYLNTKTPAENTPKAASCDHSRSPVIPLQKVSAKPGGLSQKSSQAVISQSPVQISKQSQHQYAQQRNEAQESQSALVNQQRVDEINERNFNRGVKQSLKLAERLKFREDRRTARENSLAEQRRSRGRSQTEQVLLQQDSAISIVEDAQSTQQFQMDDDAYCDYQLAQFEREDVRIAYEQSMPGNEVQQQDRFDTQQTQQAILESIQHQDISDPQTQQTIMESIQHQDRFDTQQTQQAILESFQHQDRFDEQQTQQAILASLQQQPPMTQLASSELAVLPSEVEEDGVRQASYQPLHSSFTQQHDLGQGAQRLLESSNIQQQDTSGSQTEQAALASTQQYSPVVSVVVPEVVDQSPRMTVAEHEKWERQRLPNIDFKSYHVTLWLRNNQKKREDAEYDLSKIPDCQIEQFVDHFWKITKDEFHYIYSGIDKQPLWLKFAEEFFNHRTEVERKQQVEIERAESARQEEARILEQETRLAQKALEAIKMAAKARLRDEPPQDQNGVFLIKFRLNHELVERRFWRACK
ncbi:hypothetical protein [Endozoicomonas atrinae]|uniref:hypothetical protein n=1 Tax=Endozoicomonas atrinae TaxID=1333660 RepID=UPI003B007F7F